MSAAPRIVEPDDRAIAELIDDQKREIRELQDQLREAHAELAARQIVKVHLHEDWKLADRPAKWTVILSYEKHVVFTDWPSASEFLRERRADLIMARIAGSERRAP